MKFRTRRELALATRDGVTEDMIEAADRLPGGPTFEFPDTGELSNSNPPTETEDLASE